MSTTCLPKEIKIVGDLKLLRHGYKIIAKAFYVKNCIVIS